MVMVGLGDKVVLFPRVGCLGDGTGRNHVQQVLSLTLDSRGGLMSRQTGVYIGHSHTCRETNTPVVNTHKALISSSAFAFQLIKKAGSNKA